MVQQTNEEEKELKDTQAQMEVQKVLDFLIETLENMYYDESDSEVGKKMRLEIAKEMIANPSSIRLFYAETATPQGYNLSIIEHPIFEVDRFAFIGALGDKEFHKSKSTYTIQTGVFKGYTLKVRVWSDEILIPFMEFADIRLERPIWYGLKRQLRQLGF